MWLLLSFTSIQSYVASKLTYMLRTNPGISVSVERVSISGLTQVSFSELYVYGEKNDTILYAPDLKVDIRRMSLSRKWIEIKKAVFNEPDIRFGIDDGQINFKYIIDLIGKGDSLHKKPLRLFLHDVHINNAKFSLKNSEIIQKPYGINFSDLYLNPLNIHVKGFQTLPEGGVAFHIESLSGTEKSGFVLDNLTADMFIEAQQLAFQNVNITTPRSGIEAGDIVFAFSSFRQMGGGRFSQFVNMKIDVKPSELYIGDLSYFVPDLRYLDETLNISANAEGVLSDIRIRQLDCTLGMSHFAGSLDFIGLPDIENTYLYVSTEDLVMYPSDINRIAAKTPGKSNWQLPDWLGTVEYLQYQGNFTGFFQDFVAYGRFRTNLGIISTDIQFGPSRAGISSNIPSFSFKGKLETNRFMLGRFMGLEQYVGSFSMDAMVDGVLSGAMHVNAKMNGIIKGINVNNYQYEQVAINGLLDGKKFDGDLSMHNDDVSLDFQGMLDLTEQLPAFRFAADVKNADLKKLNWMDSEIMQSASFSVTADFKGIHPDDLDGEIRLKDASMQRQGASVEVRDILLFTKKIQGVNRFILRSDIVDAEVWGEYQLSQLIPSFKTLIGLYLPSLVTSAQRNVVTSNHFRFGVDIKDVKPIFNYYDIKLLIARDTRIDGEFNPSAKDMTLSFKSPLLEWGNIKMYDAFLRSGRLHEAYQIIGGGRRFIITNNDILENLRWTGSAVSDSINLTLGWGEPGDSYQASFNSLIYFLQGEKDGRPTVRIIPDTSDMVVRYVTWRVEPDIIDLAPGAFKVGRIRIHNGDQELGIRGIYSDDERDTLRFAFRNMRLANPQMAADRKKISLGGTLDGIARFTKKNDKLLMFANLKADSLSVNTQYLGTTRLTADWLPETDNITVNLSAKDGSKETVGINGGYNVGTKNLDFNIKVESFGLDFFSPYLDNIFSGISGNLRTDLKLTGAISAPVFNGYAYLDSASMVLDYLKTKYAMSSRVSVENNHFLLKDAVIFDENRNRTTANAEVSNKNFRDFYFDFHFKSNNFQAMNLKESDMRPFYGTAYMSGEVSLKGPPSSLQLRMVAGTEAGTVLCVPLSGATGISNSDFINFVSRNNKPSYPFDFTNTQGTAVSDSSGYFINRKGMSIDLEIEANPSAEVQLIFDKKIGDVIRGNGSATMRVNIAPNGRFSMLGTYTVEKGDYLFTVQNIFQRRFEIERGGTIIWNGSPTDAIVNMKAMYRTRTSLAGLISSESGFSDLASRRVPVECILFLNDRLMNPTVTFDIQLPNVDQDVREIVNSMLYNQEEKSKQAISLMLLNNFYSEEDFFSGGTSMDALGATTSEFLSNQLGRLLGEFSSTFSLGVSYRYYSQLQTQSIELDVSQKLFKERLSLNASLGNREIVNASRSVVIDGDINMRLDPAGKYHIKGFNRSNDLSLFEPDPYYTQGVGIIYRRDFNRFSEILRRKKKTLEKETKEP